MVETVAASASPEDSSGDSRVKGAQSCKEMISRGFTLGMGVSSSLGWYKLANIGMRKGRVTSSRFIRSTTDDERNYVHYNSPRFISCLADENSGDALRAIVQVSGLLSAL